MNITIITKIKVKENRSRFFIFLHQKKIFFLNFIRKKVKYYIENFGLVAEHFYLLYYIYFLSFLDDNKISIKFEMGFFFIVSEQY